jgi:hypothetical protein
MLKHIQAAEWQVIIYGTRAEMEQAAAKKSEK